LQGVLRTVANLCRVLNLFDRTGVALQKSASFLARVSGLAVIHPIDFLTHDFLAMGGCSRIRQNSGWQQLR
jgi:hypothetical protein